MIQKKILMFSFFLAMIILSSGFLSANENSISTTNLGENVTIKQTCDCSFVNFTEVFLKDNGETILTDVKGVKQSNGYFNYEINGDKLDKAGKYVYTGIADAGNNNSIKPFSYNFEVKRKPEDDNKIFSLDISDEQNYIILLIAIVLGFVAFFLGYSYISTILLILSGLFLLFNGFQSLISFILIGIGVIIGIREAENE